MVWLGAGVMVLWLAAAVAWAVLSIPGGLMANASGAFSPKAHMRMLAGLALGQLAAAGAGVPLGLAVFMTESRSTLLWDFATLLALGVVAQIASVLLFFSRGRV